MSRQDLWTAWYGPRRTLRSLRDELRECAAADEARRARGEMDAYLTRQALGAEPVEDWRNQHFGRGPMRPRHIRQRKQQ